MYCALIKLMNSIFRCPIPDTQLEHTQFEHKHTVDPLFVVKTEIKPPSTSDKQSNEIAIVGKTIAVVKIEPKSDETLMQDEEDSIAIESKCRLCLTKDESNWIEIFSNKPYPYANVDEITQSNIVEVIERLTTIKVWESFCLVTFYENEFSFCLDRQGRSVAGQTMFAMFSKSPIYLQVSRKEPSCTKRTRFRVKCHK